MTRTAEDGRKDISEGRGRKEGGGRKEGRKDINNEGRKEARKGSE